MAEIDAVVVCLPNELHAQTAVAAIERGKHIYLEKPIALSLEEAERAGRCARARRCGRNDGVQPALQSPLSRAASRSLFASTVTGWWLEPCSRRRKSISRNGSGSVGEGAVNCWIKPSHHFDLVRFLFEDEIAEAPRSFIRTAARMTPRS